MLKLFSNVLENLFGTHGHWIERQKTDDWASAVVISSHRDINERDQKKRVIEVLK